MGRDSRPSILMWTLVLFLEFCSFALAGTAYLQGNGLSFTASDIEISSSTIHVLITASSIQEVIYDVSSSKDMTTTIASTVLILTPVPNNPSLYEISQTTPYAAAANNPTSTISTSTITSSNPSLESSIIPPPTPSANNSNTNVPSTSTGAQSTSTNNIVSKPPGKHNTGLIAGIAVLAVLLALALGGLVFFMMKSRKVRVNYHNPEPVYNDKPREDASAATIARLQNELAISHNKFNELHGSYLASSQKVATKDDKSLSHEWVQISNEIKQWANEHFRESNANVDLPANLSQTLQQVAPNHKQLLSMNRTRVFVIRALVNHVLESCFQNNEFLGRSSLSALVSTGRRNPSMNIASYNSWRSDTYHVLENSQDVQIALETAVTTIADKIESLTCPLASRAQTFSGDKARYKFLLDRIVARASKFAFDLNKQRAEFQVVGYTPGSHFLLPEMEDIQTDDDSAQGGQIQATIMSSLCKKGNEDGREYNKETIVCKARVLLYNE